MADDKKIDESLTVKANPYHQTPINKLLNKRDNTRDKLDDLYRSKNHAEKMANRAKKLDTEIKDKEQELKHINTARPTSAEHSPKKVNTTHSVTMNHVRETPKRIGEAVYPGNIGVMELVKFYSHATPKDAQHVKSLIAQKKHSEAWQYIQKATGSKLIGKQFESEEYMNEKPMEEGTAEQVDELSKDTLNSYIKKASRSIGANNRLATSFANDADRARKPIVKQASKELSDRFQNRAFKRQDGVAKAVDKLTAKVTTEAMTDAQLTKREKIVKALKKSKSDFEKRYGDNAESVMYATATKQAMKENIESGEE